MSDHLRNLRNRPFLVVNSIHRPVAGVDTKKKGWAEVKGSFEVFERVGVVDRVSDRALRDATVIIDIMGSRVVTSRFDAKPEEIVEYYLGKYMDECKQGLDRWLSKQAREFAQSKDYTQIMEQAKADRLAEVVPEDTAA